MYHIYFQIVQAIPTNIISVVHWGLQKQSKKAFRPAMELASGELSSLGGKLLLMTATASQRTIRTLKEQFPEIKKWNLILNLPIRNNVTILTPPSDIISSNYVVTLAPFVSSMKSSGETFLVLVRGTPFHYKITGRTLVYFR